MTEPRRSTSVASSVLAALGLAACVQAAEFDLNSLPPGAYCSRGAAIAAGAIDALRPEDPAARAAVTGDMETLRRWRASGRAEPAHDSGMSLLHWAALGGQAEAAAFLLDAGADPNARDRAGDTPLGAAAAGCHVAVIRLLLARGADPELRNARGNRPYDMMTDAGATELLPLLRR